MINIRTIKFKDIPKVKRINEKYMNEHYSDEIYEMQIIFNGNASFVAEKDGIIVGYILGIIKEMIDNECIGHVMSICVIESLRSQNIGFMLMNSFIGCIRNYKKSKNTSTFFKITLNVRKSNKIAIRFYESRFGFKIVDVLADYYCDEDAFIMERLFLD